MARLRLPWDGRAAWGLALIGSLAIAPVAAAQPIAPADTDIEAVPLESLVDLPLGAAALHEEKTSESAAAAFVLSGDEIRLQGFRTLFEALRSVPGLFGYRDDSFPAIGVRGVGLLSDYGTRLLVLLDGHPLNDSVGLGGTLVGRDLPIPIDAVKRIEVVKGPVGSVYGPTAFLGLVNVVTVDADDRASQLRAGGEASQSKVRGGEGSAVVTTRAGELKVTAAIQGYRSRGDDYDLPELLVPLAGRAVPGSSRVAGVNSAGSESAFARLEWRGLSLAGACGGSSSGLVTAAYGSNVADDRTRLSTRRCYAEAGYSRRLDGQLSISLRAAWDENLYQDVYAYAPPPESYGLFRDLGRDRWGTADARVTWSPLDGTFALVGLTGQYHRTLQSTWADGLPTIQQDPISGVGSGDIPKDYGTLNGYLLLEQRLGAELRLHLGATWYWHELFGQRVTPKAALVWTPSDRDVVKLIYSQGFRAPTASEAFYDDSYSYLANPRLRPEVADAGEVVYERRLGGLASLTASAFLERYTSLIRYETVPAPEVATPDPGNPLDFRQQAHNLGSVWLSGGELAVSARSRWLSGYGGVSVQHVGEAGRVDFPSVTGNVAVSSRAVWEPLALSANLSATSRRAYDPGNLPASGATSVVPQVLVNACAILDVPRARGLSLELAVRNLLGAAAPDPLVSDFAPVTALPQPPRTLRLGLRYRFD